MRTKRFIGWTGAILAAALCAPVMAQTYPSKPIRLLVGFSAGGGTDVIARFYGQRLTALLGVPIIVDNRPGGSQVIAINLLKSAAPDGYTLFVGTGSALSQGPGVRPDLPYDPLRDMTFVGLMTKAPGILIASPKLPVGNLDELVAHAQANPGKLNFGSSGVGSASHLQFEFLMSISGIRMTHVPYKSAAGITRALREGSIQLGIGPIQGAIAALQGGWVKPVAVTGSRRIKGLEGVPPMSESAVKGTEGLDPYTYYGVVGPRGLPEAVVTRLNEAINKVSRDPETAAYVEDRLYNEPGVGSPAAFRAFVERDLAKWKKLDGVVTVTK